MWHGRRQLGQEVALTLVSVGSDGVPAWPSSPPTVDIWKGTARVSMGLKMPKVDSAVTGLFRLGVYLGGAYSAGRYCAILRWKVSSYQGVRPEHFEIAAGGNADGAVLSLAHHEMPQARFLVAQLDSGRLWRGKNPSV